MTDRDTKIKIQSLQRQNAEQARQIAHLQGQVEAILLTLSGTSSEDTAQPETSDREYTVTHTGFGRWAVMKGDERIDDIHYTKESAAEYVAELNAGC